MPIKIIEFFSNSINPRKFDPTISFNEMTITIGQCLFAHNGSTYSLDEDVAIEIQNVDEKTKISVYYVLDKLKNDVIIVTDTYKMSDTPWVPDESQHTILHCILDGELSPGMQNLSEMNLNVYTLKLPPQEILLS